MTGFSAELPCCCFCAEIKVLRIGQNFLEIYFTINKKNTRAKNHRRGCPGWARYTRVRHPLQARPGGLWLPRGPPNPNYNSINTYFRREKIREEVLLRFTRRSRRHLLFFIGMPDLEPVRGSGEGNLHSSSSPTLLHRQLNDAPHRE